MLLPRLRRRRLCAAPLTLRPPRRADSVGLWIKARRVTVKGERGVLQRDFGHTKLDLRKVDDDTKVRVDIWLSSGKQKAVLRTVCSHIQNMITGVTQGYCYKMRMAYAHFPINVNIVKGKSVEIRNFLGEKQVRYVRMLGDTTILRSETVKDQLELTGNDIELVSRSGPSPHPRAPPIMRSVAHATPWRAPRPRAPRPRQAALTLVSVPPSPPAAHIHQCCAVKKKDIRKFLDGIYVSEKGPIVQSED